MGTLKKAYQEAADERAARERGRTLPHYTARVAKKLTSRPKRGKATPPKRASD